MISVVMPTYNYAEFLPKTIHSVLAQSHTDFELIVIDNFSTDKTEEIVKGFADKRIRYFKFANDGIVAASRNYGIYHSRGQYIAFLDSDDIWYADKLEMVAWQFHVDSQTDLICHAENWVYKDQNNKKVPVRYGPGRSYEDLLFKGNSLSTSAIVVKKTKLEEVQGFSESTAFSGAEDYELWLRLSRVCKIHFLPQILGEYTIHQSSISGDIDRRTKMLLNVVETHFGSFQEPTSTQKRLIQKRKAEILRQGARDLLRQGKVDEAQSYIQKSVQINPWSVKSQYWLWKSAAGKAAS